MTLPILRIENATKSLKEKPLIDSVSFNIYPGEIVGLLGPNGAGKTTLMKMILGLTNFDKGEIFINELSIQKHRTQCLSKMGGLIETPFCYPFLTGYQNLRYFASLYKGISIARIKEVIQLVNLENAQNKKIKYYSLGMKQRLGIAQALLHQPDLLILDEPMNGLDPHGIREMREYIKKLANENKMSVLISSHIISEMELLCDSVILLKNGKTTKLNYSEREVNSGKVIISVSNPQKALKILSEEHDYDFVITPDEDVTGEISFNDTNDILESLIRNKIHIYEFIKVKESLEDKFLKETGSDSIA